MASSCEWSPTCRDEATHRLEIRYVESDSQSAHCYCRSHLLLRRSAIESDELLEVLEADVL